MDIFLTISSVLLVIFTVIHYWATYLMGKEAYLSAWKFPALNERFFTGIIQSVSATGFGLLGANRVLDWHWDEGAVIIVLLVSLLIKVLPSISWVWLYYTDGFHTDGSVKEDR